MTLTVTVLFVHHSHSSNKALQPLSALSLDMHSVQSHYTWCSPGLHDGDNFPIMVVSSCHMLSRSQATNGEQGHFPALSVTSLLASRQCEGRNCLIQRQTVQETDLRPFCGEPAGWTGSRSMWGEKWDLQRGQKLRIGRTGILFWSHQRKWQLAETEDPEEYWGCRLKRWMQDGGNKLLKKLRHKKRKLIEKLLWKGEMFWECSPRKDTGPRNQWMWVALASG